MPFDYRKLLLDYGVPYNDEIAIHRGYIAIPCPFCTGSYNKLYGAIHVEKNIYKCWKCSGHSLYDLIKTITGQNWYILQKKYILTRPLMPHEKKVIERPEKITLPEHTSDLNDRAKQYLEKRGFDPYELSDIYGLKSTGHIGKFNFRIIIPISFQNELVSYTSRDYTGQSNIRYLSCEKVLEVIDHKTIVYGYDTVPGDHAIAVEGPADKWRMGVNAVATFGTGFKKEQVNILSSFKKVTILYDPEPEAQRLANNLGELLDGLGVMAEVLFLKDIKDPGELRKDEAENLIREIINKES